MKLEFKMGIHAYENLRKILPQDRLKEEEEIFEKNYGNTVIFHPLTKLLYDVKKDLEDGKTTGVITSNIVKLIILELDIKLLQEKNIPRINEKISELISKNYPKFDSIIYELRIASYLITSGHTVEFIEESNTEERPDLLINNEIKLDCKNKNSLTNLDQFNYEYFDKYWIEILNKLNLEQKFNLIYAHFKRSDKVNEDLANFAKKRILEKIDENKTGKFEFVGFDIYIYKMHESDGGFINTGLPFLGIQQMMNINYLVDRLDVTFRKVIGNTEYNNILRRGISFFTFDPNIADLEGKAGLKVNAILCATKKLPEKFSSILEGIEKANGQIGENTPGIASIRITDVMTRIIPFDFQQVAILVNDLLPKTPNISTVLFTMENYDDNTNEYRFRVRIIKNNYAKNKLSAKYDNLESL